MKAVDLSNYKTMYLVMENCEDIEVPIENVKKLEFRAMTDYSEEIFYEVDCRIEGLSGVSSSFGAFAYRDGKTPFQRIHEYKDIVYIVLKDKDDNNTKYEIMWDYHDQENEYQITTMHAYDTIEISVKLDNKKSMYFDKIAHYAQSAFEEIESCAGCACFECPCDPICSKHKVRLCNILEEFK